MRGSSEELTSERTNQGLINRDGRFYVMFKLLSRGPILRSTLVCLRRTLHKKFIEIEGKGITTILMKLKNIEIRNKCRPSFQLCSK